MRPENKGDRHLLASQLWRSLQPPYGWAARERAQTILGGGKEEEKEPVRIWDTMYTTPKHSIAHLHQPPQKSLILHASLSEFTTGTQDPGDKAAFYLGAQCLALSLVKVDTHQAL